MSEDDSITTGERVPVLIADHRIVVLVFVTILIALVFTSVGLLLYTSSGAAQVDLSRPDYEGITNAVEQENGDPVEFIEYPAVGPIDEAALTGFDELYGKKIENVTGIDAFGSDPLAADALSIDKQDN